MSNSSNKITQSTRYVSLLFGDTPAEDMLNTLRSFGAVTSKEPWLWVYPSEGEVLLEINVVTDIEEYEADLTADTYTEWWQPLKADLGKEPSLYLRVGVDGGEAATRELGRLATTLLGKHSGIVWHDDINKKSVNKNQIQQAAQIITQMRAARQNTDGRPVVTGWRRDAIIFIQKSILYLTRYWFLIANLLAAIVLALGFLAPALMAEGQPEAGQAIYRFLATQNHQLPQRSYFLFSQAGGIQSYSAEQIVEFGANPRDIESFIGNEEVGFKTALNHRMVAIFIAILFGGLAWGFSGQRPQISFIWLLMMALPLLLDGLSNMISDNGDVSFRQTNEWAIVLTGGAFPASFYVGTTIGTLNWLLRTVTGFIFGLGLVWFLYSYLSNRFVPIRAKLEPKLRKVGVIK